MAETKKKIIKLKHYVQTTDYSCGPASLKMILSYHGLDVSEEILIRLTDANPNGVDVNKLIMVLTQLGFRAEPIEGSYKTLKTYFREKPMPILLHLEKEEHYVVLVGINQKYIYIVDPSIKGIQKIKRGEFVQQWQITKKMGWFMLIEDLKKGVSNEEKKIQEERT